MQEGHKGHSLSKSDVEKILNEGKAEHIIKNIGKQRGEYKSRYILDYKIVPTVTEYRI